MDRRTRLYVIMGIILAAESVVLRILKYLGITTLPLWLNILWSAAYSAPIVAILYTLGGDRRVKKGWRFFCRFLSGFICVSFVVGTVLQLFGL